jgi:hypothetical protein
MITGDENTRLQDGMISWDVIILCYHLMLSSPCYHFVLSSHVIILCYHSMLSFHVIIPCYHPMLSYQDDISWYQSMLSSNVLISCYHLMLSCSCYHRELSSQVIILLSFKMIIASVIIIIPVNVSHSGFMGTHKRRILRIFQKWNIP